jgi:amino acid adenylation domain-containing protein
MQICVTEYLDRAARLFPKKVAVKDSHVSLTFSGIRDRAVATAAVICKFNIHKTPVAVYMQKCADMVMGFAAINYSGNFYVPIDTAQPENRIKNIFQTIESKIALTNNENYKRLSSFYDGIIINVDEINIDNYTGTLTNIDRILDGQIDTDPVYCMFTSGSTGKPKGVVISHRGVIDYIDWAKDEFAADEDTIIGNQAPFYFDNSTLDIYLAFATGATLIIIPSEYYSFPVRLIDALNEEKVNFIFWVPSVLVDLANIDIFAVRKIKYLAKILFAGEVMPNKHLNYWRKHLPNCIYANLYGPTEITVDCIFFIVNRSFSDDELLPIGKPCRNTNILILNEKDQVAAVGEFGELCVRGTSLSMGYYNDREKTDRVFVQNPLNRSYPEIIYRTGDIAYWNVRGEIMYVGRRDTQIKHSGYRIELGEIESAALGTNLVKTVCAAYDKNNKEIVMFYQADNNIDAVEFRKLILRSLPKYMAPARLYRLDKMPLNRNGKIDRIELNKLMEKK